MRYLRSCGLLGLCALVVGGSLLAQNRAITIKGSDTMVLLGQRWAEVYMKKNPGVKIQVTGGGSGTGIAALINGTTDICESSRPMKDKEKDSIKEKFGKGPKEIPVAVDGLAIYLHNSNPVTEFSLQQLRDIYTGRITNWKDVGGKDAKIILYSRENNSGTYAYFKEHVLENKDFHPNAQTLPGTAAVVNAVAKDPKAIGYGGIAYHKGIRTVKVKKDASSPAVEPTMETVLGGTYPISRNLFWYVPQDSNSEVQKLVAWVLSTEGQNIVKDVGYYPLPKTAETSTSPSSKKPAKGKVH